MRSSRTANHAYASRLLCLGAAFIMFVIAGCGGGSSGSTGGGGTTTVTSVTVSPATKTITAGNSVTFSATVLGNDNPSQTVAWSFTPASAGTMAAGVFTSSSTIGAITTVTVTAASTVPGYTNITGMATLTVDPIPPAQPTVTISASPMTITLGDTTTLAWSSTGATSCTASGAWSGAQTVSSTATETPTATGTPTYTLDCTGAGGSATASATVTVNPAPLPNIGSVTPNTFYLDQQAIIANIQASGSNLQGSDLLSASPNINISGFKVLNAGQLEFNASLGTQYFSPGYITLGVCKNANSSSCGTPGTLAFLGARNYLAISAAGELFFLDQAQGAPDGQNGYVRKYKEDGTADGSFFEGGLAHCIDVDEKTGLVVVDGGNQNEDGSSTFIAPQGFPSGPILACAADNGYAGLVQPANNSASFYDMTGGANSQPTVYTASDLGNYPEPIAMKTFGTETDAFLVSVNDTPSPLLHLVRAADAYTGEEPALALTGITPMGAVSAADPTAGGVQVVVFDSGFAIGTIAVLSTYDDLLVLADKNTWSITQSVKLSGVPFRIIADDVDGAVIVALANPTTATTTYESVDALSGKITPLTATSSLLSVGINLSSDGTKIYSGQRNQLQVENNQ
jgi:hypothetical protein